MLSLRYTNNMTVPEGIAWGLSANIVYQLIEADLFRREKKIWPWRDDLQGITIPSFMFGVFVKLIAAAFVLWLLTATRQISGIFAAAMTGPVASETFANLIKKKKEEVNHD